MTQRATIPYAHQSIDENEVKSLGLVLQSDWLTQGPQISEFESRIADFCEAKYAVSFCNGTAALHAAMVVLGLKKGDVGIVPAITFAASANCLLYTGATPLFSDVTDGIPQLNPDDVAKKINANTKVLIPVHFAGDLAPIQMLHNLAKKHSLFVVEDACHAFGSKYFDTNTQKWRRIGSCQYSDMTVFSFHPVKNITTGEGGIITTNNVELYEKLKKFRHHGITLPTTSMAWDYSIDTLGMNYRLTDLQAALGIAQLKKVDSFRDKKITLLNRYLAAFEGENQLKFLVPKDLEHKHMHLCLVQLADPALRNPLFNYLRENGVLAQMHYKPLYRHPLYQKINHEMPDQFPQAETYFASALTIPLYADLSFDDQDRVIHILKDFLKNRV